MVDLSGVPGAIIISIIGLGVWFFQQSIKDNRKRDIAISDLTGAVKNLTNQIEKMDERHEIIYENRNKINNLEFRLVELEKRVDAYIENK